MNDSKMWKNLVLILISSLGCNDALIFDSTFKFSPPAIYEVWYTEARQCAGNLAQGRYTYKRLNFYRIGEMEIEVNGQRAVAFEKQGSIYITNRYLMDKRVVKHEMMHSITGINDHSSIFYKCNLMNGQSGENE